MIRPPHVCLPMPKPKPFRKEKNMNPSAWIKYDHMPNPCSEVPHVGVELAAWLVSWVVIGAERSKGVAVVDRRGVVHGLETFWTSPLRL